MIPKHRLYNATANQNERRAREAWAGPAPKLDDFSAPVAQVPFALAVIAIAVAGGGLAGAIIAALQL